MTPIVRNTDICVRLIVFLNGRPYAWAKGTTLVTAGAKMYIITSTGMETIIAASLECTTKPK